MSMNRIATVADLAAEAPLALERLAGDVLADVAAEQVADPLALAQPGDHLVEAALEQAELAAVVDGDLDVEVPLGDLGDGVANRDDRIRRHPGGDQRREQPDEQAGPGEHEHRDGELVAADSRRRRARRGRSWPGRASAPPSRGPR